MPLGIDGRAAHLLDLFHGDAGPLALWFARAEDAAAAPVLAAALGDAVRLVVVGARFAGHASVTDSEGKLALATKARPGEVLLVRPDMHLAARVPATATASLAAAAAYLLGIDTRISA